MNTDAPSDTGGGVSVCSYCESSIVDHAHGHIEHFRPKNRFPALTFEWENLYLSCMANSHCGHYKDSAAAPHYDPDRLIAPDTDDPGEYLVFHASGEVGVRPGITADKTERAQLTITVLNLDETTLRARRRATLLSYRDIIGSELDEISGWPAEERDEYLRGEIEASRGAEYSTAIRHFLTR